MNDQVQINLTKVESQFGTKFSKSTVKKTNLKQAVIELLLSVDERRPNTPSRRSEVEVLRSDQVHLVANAFDSRVFLGHD